MPFTCANARFGTDTARGYPHGMGQPAGSVLQGPITDDGNGGTLWLEYVIDSHGPGGWQTEPLWLMLYDRNGSPTIKQSATFDRSSLQTIAAELIRAALP